MTYLKYFNCSSQFVAKAYPENPTLHNIKDKCDCKFNNINLFSFHFCAFFFVEKL